MQTAPESSTETDICHNSNDLSAKESEGTKYANSTRVIN